MDKMELKQMLINDLAWRHEDDCIDCMPYAELKPCPYAGSCEIEECVCDEELTKRYFTELLDELMK